jgi:hypothetical protein
MKFVLYIDRKAGSKAPYEYKTMTATDLETAIAEADAQWNDEIYLMRIMRKEGKTENGDGCKVEKYRATLARRSFGWHLNNTANAEGEHYAKRFARRGWEHIECCNA